ncbi:MAG: hypothetical protein RL736_165 [Pseudomonadota bacterium]|jgi:TP901 family phage tail tape measure protein
MAAITLDIGGNTRRLDRDIQQTVNKVYTVNLKSKGDQPLGRITGQVNEFNKSLDASNARVIAFGASAGIIFGVEKAFSALVQSTIEVQKSLADINVILNASTQELQKFGSGLFSIAKDTGQSFQAVATAATEFSRQGLGIEETLKRTSDALILSRLSGLDTAKSVETLTAAINSFASQAVTASEIVNKFANVDAAFAVSSGDLADAISRVGSSAAQSGVNLDELIAIVTSAQQTTARGGAVIGNSFKTIFTRLQRGKVIDLLESLGITTTNGSGQLKSTIQLLQDLGSVYDKLGSQQQSYVAEQVGGVFQINILKAALADLGKEYSVYSSALNVSSGSTDQAIRRNEELNKTYAAQLNSLQENARQLAASAGERLLGPSANRLVGGTNQLLGGMNESEGQNLGTVLGRGILDGIGQFISGPGLALIGGVLLKLFKDLSKFAVGSVQQLLGLNSAAIEQKDLQQSINQILAKNPALLQLALQGEEGLNNAANSLLGSLQKQTIELQKQATVAEQISKAFIAQAGISVKGGVPNVPIAKKIGTGKAAGFIPNFVKEGAIEKAQAMALGATPSVRPHMSQGTIGGRKFVMNDQETEYPGVGSNGDSMVIPHYAAKGIIPRGIIPNFAATPNVGPYVEYAKSLQLKVGKTGSPAFNELVKIVNKKGGQRSDDEIKGDIRQLAAARQGVKTTGRALQGEGKFAYIYAAQGSEKKTAGKVQLTKDGKPVPYSFTSLGTKNPFTFEDDINNRLTPIIEDLAKQVLPTSSKLLPIGQFNEFLDKSAFSQVYGRLFEAVVNRALSKSVKQEAGNQRFEFFKDELSGPNGTKLQDIFNAPNLSSFAAADLKFRPPDGSPDSTVSFIKKMASVIGIPYDSSRGGVKLAAQGFIPNFSALQDAISREQGAGIPKSKIYIAQHARLAATGYNPLGLGVFNKIDEPTSAARNSAIKNRGKATGFIPNFAITDPDIQAADTGTAITALTAELSGLAFSFAFNKDEFQKSLRDLTQTTKDAANSQRRRLAQEIALQKSLGKMSGATSKEIQQAIKEQFGKRLAAAPEKDAKLGFGQKSNLFLKSNTFALSAAAPILAETIKNIAGQETPGARKTGAAASFIGQVGSFAATGAMIAPGALGAGIGAATGAILGIPALVDELTGSIPELARAAQKAGQDLTKFGDTGQRLLSSSSELSSLMANDASQEDISKARDMYAKALSELSDMDRERLSKAARVGNLEEEYAIVLQEKIQQTGSAQRFVQLQALEEKKTFGVFPGGFNTNPNNRQGKADAELLRNSFTGLFKDLSTLPQELKNQIKAGKITEQEAVQQNFQRQKDVGLPQLQELAKKSDPFQSGGKGLSNSLLDLEGILKNIIPESETKAQDINQLLNLADDDLISFSNVLKELIRALNEGPEALKNALDAALLDATANEARNDVLKKSTDAVNATINSIQKNIAVQNLWRSAIDNLNEGALSFENNLKIADKFTNKQNLVESVVGTGSDFGRKLEIGGELATIAESQRSALAGSAIELKNSVRSALEDVSQENQNKIIEKLRNSLASPSQKGADAIQSNTEQKTSEILQEEQKLSQTIASIESLVSDVTSGLDSGEFLKGIGSSIASFGLGSNSEITNKIELALAKFNTDQLDQAQKAYQQRRSLAKEATQKILMQKLNQTIGAFGGADEFLQPTQGGLIAPIQSTIETIKPLIKERLSAEKGTVQGRPKNDSTIDLGRESLRLITQLKTLSGGAYKVNPQGEAFNRAVTGRTSDITTQLSSIDKLIKQQERVGRGGDLTRIELQAFKDSIDSLGGAKNISELQVSAATGSLSEKRFNEIVGRYKNPALQQLQKIDPAFADIISQTADLSTNDPSIQSLTTLNTTQAQALIELQKVNANLIEKGQKPLELKGGAGVIESGIKTAVASSLGASSNTQEATTQLSPQKSISQIEAETVKARDQKQFEQWSQAGGLGLGPTESNFFYNSDEKYANTPGAYNPYKLASQTDMADPVFMATTAGSNTGMGLNSFDRIQSEKEGIFNLLNPKYSDIKGEEMGVSMGTALQRYVTNNPFSPITYDNAAARAGESTRTKQTPANIYNNETGGPKAPTVTSPQQVANDREKITSATQNNTAVNEGLVAATKALQAAAEKLSSTVEEKNNNNTNNAQNNSTTSNSTTTQPADTNIGPFNTVVNGTVGSDFDSKVNVAIDKLRSEIYTKLNIKMPPTTS